MPKVYTPKHGRTGKGKDNFPKNPHCIGRQGAMFSPHSGQFEYRGSEKETVNKGQGLPNSGKKEGY